METQPTSTFHPARRVRLLPDRTTLLFFGMSMALVIVILYLTLFQTYALSLDNLEKKIESVLTSTAKTLSRSERVKEALTSGVCPPDLMAYLDDIVASTEDLDIITVADEHSVRCYHINRTRIGETFVGGDQSRVLAGESYLSDATGTLGPQRRAFSPVTDDSGAVIGFVMVSTKMTRLDEMRGQIIETYVNLALLLLMSAALISLLLSIVLQNMLLGHKPEELIRTYLAQGEVLEALDEGLISVDRDGYILLANQAAVRMLGQSELVDLRLDKVICTPEGTPITDLAEPKESAPTSRPNILCSNVPVAKNGKRIGTVLVLTDRSEAMHQAEQLTGSRHIIQALRANSHEFMNKLQIISGLLQMGHSQDALAYITSVSETHAGGIASIMACIQNHSVAALLLGKLSRMRELDISLTLLQNSSLPAHSRFLSTNDLVTVIGNLMENGIEAIDAKVNGGERRLVLQITEDAQGLMIMVQDSGIGIAGGQLHMIFKRGFSTKAAEGRGTGMYLVNEIAVRTGGSIEVESELGEGTSITAVFHRERNQGGQL